MLVLANPYMFLLLVLSPPLICNVHVMSVPSTFLSLAMLYSSVQCVQWHIYHTLLHLIGEFQLGDGHTDRQSDIWTSRAASSQLKMSYFVLIIFEMTTFS